MSNDRSTPRTILKGQQQKTQTRKEKRGIGEEKIVEKKKEGRK